MDTAVIIVIVVVVLAIVGWLMASSRNRSEKPQDHFGTEYDRSVQTVDSEKVVQTELDERQKHVADLDLPPLTTADRERYLVNWAEIQSEFVDEPGLAIGNADRLIKEVMQARSYPVAMLDQSAVDIPVSYPALESSYRAAREIAIKNEQHLANAEDQRQALIHYRSLFEELLGTETDVQKENL